MQTILLIEDEAAIADTVIYALKEQGYVCHWCTLGNDGINKLRMDNDIALVVLDVGLPDGSGFEFCKQIRQFSDVPVIFLTARNDEIDRIVGLEIGADDYMVKPFSPRELATRVKVILRRVRNSDADSSNKGLFSVNEDRMLISYRDEQLELTRYEYLILLTLLRRPGMVLTREQIMDQVWENPAVSLERSVDTHIKSLRSKLRRINNNIDPIITHRGIGYSINTNIK